MVSWGHGYASGFSEGVKLDRRARGVRSLHFAARGAGLPAFRPSWGGPSGSRPGFRPVHAGGFVSV